MNRSTKYELSGAKKPVTFLTIVLCAVLNTAVSQIISFSYDFDGSNIPLKEARTIIYNRPLTVL